jgi:hypothetical protein
MPSMQSRRGDVIVGVDTHKDEHVAVLQKARQTPRSQPRRLKSKLRPARLLHAPARVYFT